MRYSRLLSSARGRRLLSSAYIGYASRNKIFVSIIRRSILFLLLFREPAALDAFALLEEFADGPERRGSEYAEQRRQQHVLDEQCADNAGDADKEEYPPRARPEVVLRLDYDWMEQSYYQEGRYCDDDSLEVHAVYF